MKKNTEKLAGWVYPVLVATMLLNVYALHEIQDRPEETVRERPTDIVYPLADDEYFEELTRRGPDPVVVESDEVLVPVHASAKPDWARFLEALAMKESSSLPGEDYHKRDGDGGLAIGPFQIHEAFWKDSNQPGRWEDCVSWDYSVKVVRAYYKRYVPRAWERGDWEVIARTHNGGPTGAEEEDTEGYWADVKRIYDRTK